MMTTVIQSRFCCLVFLVVVSTKISAAVVSNAIDSGDDYGLVKGLTEMKDPVDFRFTKFLDIRYDVDDNSVFDKKDTTLSREASDKKSIQNFLNNQQDRLEADNNHVLLKKINVLAYQIEKLSKMLTEMNDQIKKNISHLSQNQISINKNIQNLRFSRAKSNGVTYSGLYPRTEPRRTKDNQTVIIPRDCREVLNRGINVSGVYEIQPKLSPKPFLVLCDMETRGGGWTHVQKRFDGSQDFYLGWREYKFGFGDLDGEFWLGLQNIYYLTAASAGAELLIEMIDINLMPGYAHYGSFKVGSEPDGFPLSLLSNFSGDAGDSLTYHLGQKFSTKDYDQDQSEGSCAEKYFGAWWYKKCHRSDLNGKNINLKVSKQCEYTGATWIDYRNNTKYPIAQTRMMVRKSSIE